MCAGSFFIIGKDKSRLTLLKLRKPANLIASFFIPKRATKI